MHHIPQVREVSSVLICLQMCIRDRNKGELTYFGDPADMVEMANGKVWQLNIDKTEFEKALDKSLVIHHIQQGDTIRDVYKRQSSYCAVCECTSRKHCTY